MQGNINVSTAHLQNTVGDRPGADPQIIVLTRLNLIPGIDQDTPLVVLEEISRAHNVLHVIKRQDAVFLNEVRNKPVGFVHDPIQDDDWTTIAQYVNPDQSWSIPELLTAYNHLQYWETRTQFVPPNDFTFGPQTPADPTRLNACVLYAICKANGIQTTRRQTMYQMATVCSMLIRDEDYARTVLYNTISHVPRTGLLSLYLISSTLMGPMPEPVDTVREISNYAALEELLVTFNTIQSLRLCVWPHSYPEAVVLAALNFCIDLSSARDPIAEYSLLYRDPSEYVPEDPELKARVQTNPLILRLDEYFNPLLPHDLYTEEGLVRMAKTEGYTVNDLRRDSAYDLLQTAYLSYTFYHGRQLGIKNTRTPFLYDDVDELSNEQIVCFGIQGGEAVMTAFRYSELGELFKEHRNFVNPLQEDDTFSGVAIAKLKNLCKMLRAGDIPEIIQEREAVYEAIVTTELFTDASQAKAKELYQTHNQAQPNVKAAIECAVIKLLELSMYMRGWTGSGEYPIERAPVDNQVLVDLNVTLAFIAFELTCAELEDIGQQILDLPLLRFRAGVFHPVTLEEYGRTIAERIAIVKAGDDHTNYDSCIRISSNYFAVTSYRYMEVLGMGTPFLIDRLRDIS